MHHLLNFLTLLITGTCSTVVLQTCLLLSGTLEVVFYVLYSHLASVHLGECSFYRLYRLVNEHHRKLTNFYSLKKSFLIALGPRVFVFYLFMWLTLLTFPLELLGLFSGHFLLNSLCVC